jgi:hypothetical protein
MPNEGKDSKGAKREEKRGEIQEKEERKNVK